MQEDLSGYLKVTTENLTRWTLSGRKKPPKTNFRGALKYQLLHGGVPVSTGRAERQLHVEDDRWPR